ncbi:MAG: DUF2318 domain-containing protein [Planctomycetes bacterium]|nr:DUF2318 domain-containing protein [Planctomycetota bacterium]
MFESFVITLREGVEAALIIGLLLAYLTKTNRAALKGPVLWGFATAVGASVALAVVVRLLEIDPEKYEGAILAVSALLVVSMVIWMHRHGRRLKAEIEQKVETLSSAPGPAQKFWLFLFAFLMVGREGVETVLFLSAASLSTQGTLTIIGGLAGIAIAILLGVALVKGSLRIDLRKFFGVTAVMLLIFAVQLLAGAFHEFIEQKQLIVARPDQVMAVLGPLVRNSAIFIIALLALPFALIAWSALRAPACPPMAADNPAEARKQRALHASERTWRLAFSTLAIVVVAAIGTNFVYASRGLELTPTTLLEPREGAVRVALSSVKEGELARFGIFSVDRVVRFIIYRGADGPRTAFDACLICFDKGYVQQGEHLICLNCLAEIFAPTIGLEGGCNPIPLTSTTQGDEIVVRVSDLEAGRNYFEALPEGVCKGCGMVFKITRPNQTACDMPECQGK